MTAFIITFVLALIAGPVFIPLLTRLKFGQTVRDDGPASHFKKTGTPTIGGIIFIIPILLTSIYFFVREEVFKILPLLFVTIGFGLIGFIDDYLKIIKKSKDGLYAYQKLAGLLLVATAFTIYISYTGLGTDIIVPFMGKSFVFDLAWAFIPFTIFVLLAITNAVNITDGLDGLASGVTLIVMVFFALLAMTLPQWEHVKIFAAIVAGGCLGFMVFNVHPAKAFMGDTGSLALGGAVGAVAIVMKLPLLLVIVGGVYVVETLSVIMQVASYKLTGKRVFKMAPLHHHFELAGWKETKIVYVFWTVTVVLCFIGFFALGIRFF